MMWLARLARCALLGSRGMLELSGLSAFHAVAHGLNIGLEPSRLRKEIFSPRSHPSRRDYIHSEANDAICVTTYAITITSKIQSKIARTFIRGPAEQDECQHF